MKVDGMQFEVEMQTAKTKYASPLDDPSYHVLDRDALRKISEFIKAIESIEHTINDTGQNVMLNSPILVQGEGFRFGWIKPIDDFWVFVPDVKND